MISADDGTFSYLPVPVIRVQGTPEHCGFEYGVAAQPLIAANLDLYLRRFRVEAGLDLDAVRAAGEAFRRTTVQLHPRVAQMLDGVAEGAGVGVGEIYALNARTELIYGTTTAPAAVDGRDGGCTAAGVLGTHTASGNLLLGQNWDWHPDQREAMVLLATRDERGLTVLALAEAGMLAKTGLNSAGVGVCVNMLGCDRDGLPTDGTPPGVPYHVLLRAALEADSLAGAFKAAMRGTRNSSINLLLGQAGESGGELIDLELVPGDAGWLHPVDGLLTHANHLESGVRVHDTMKDFGGSSMFRSARARRLLAPAALAGKVTEDDLAELFGDHASFPHAICRHVDERDAVADRSETVYSVLLDLDDLRLGIAAGPPCGHEYGWLSLTR
ncbi:C45 family peptidase [Micromonospora sp. NPDC049523]|uniref:C45 family peptidase n=1 Tax=Micromonospora sp. NPDC049523 TaxID=3155921 RepID=UPI0034234955